MAAEALSVPDLLPYSRRVVLIDIDGTLTQGLTISSFAQFLDDNGSFNPSSLGRMQEDFSRYSLSDHGHDAYEQLAKDLVLHYGEGTMGHKVSDVQVLADKFFESVQRGKIPDYSVYPFSAQLIHIMNKVGTTIAISGSPAESLAPLKGILNLADLKATTIGQQNGVYTGSVDLNLALDLDKEKEVQRQITDETDLARSFAFGDTLHDLPLLEAVGNPFVVSGNSHLEAVARRNKWPIITPGNAIDQVTQRVDTIFKR